MWTSSTACACRPTIHNTPCAGFGCRPKKKQATTTASPTKDCGRSATSRTRGPFYRASDWECYKEVNKKFAVAVIEEMKDSPNPTVFIQDYHLALLPQLVRMRHGPMRGWLSSGTFHGPIQKPSAFALGKRSCLTACSARTYIGFHIPLHCNNFLSTVDRVLESRTDREHMTASRKGHVSTVHPYPVSVALDSMQKNREAKKPSRDTLLAEFGLHAETLVIGVDRMDYTKGIVERTDRHRTSSGRASVVSGTAYDGANWQRRAERGLPAISICIGVSR